MGHGVEGVDRSAGHLDADTAKAVAATLGALAAPSRLGILTRLRQGPHTVGELAGALDMETSAVSHQLRLLRNLGLVDNTRQGRNVVYRLYDDHVGELLDQAIHHVEHRRLGWPDRGRAG